MVVIDNNNIYNSINTTNPIFISNAGNIGIGNLTPNVALDVTGNIKCSTGLTVTSGGATVTGGATISTGGLTVTAGGLTVTAGTVSFPTGSISSTAISGTLSQWTTLNNDIYYYNATSGRVGIGTNTAPTCALDVIGNIKCSTGLTVTSGGLTVTAGGLTVTAGGLTVTAGTVSFPSNSISTSSINGTLSQWTTLNNDIYYYNATSGKVGIGTNTAPTAPLHVIASGTGNPDTNGIYCYNPTNSTGQNSIVNVRVAGSGGTSSAGNPFFSMDVANVAGWSIGLDNANSQCLKIAQSWSSLTTNTRVTILTNGNVGIGSTSPVSILDLGGVIRYNGLQSSTYLGAPVSGGGASSRISLWQNSNTVPHGFGMDNSTLWYSVPSGENHKFYNGTSISMVINGNVGIGSASPAYLLDVAGTIRATADVIAYSDKRVKTNLEVIQKPLEILDKITGYYYVRTDIEDKKRCIGVIAQELLEVLPEVVSQDDTGIYSVAYGNITAFLIEALKEEVRLRKELGEEVKELREQIKILQKGTNGSL